MAYRIIIQRCCKIKNIPSSAQIKTWLTAVLSNYCDNAEITIRITDEAESTALNQQYRQKSGPTNILSFAYEIAPLSGDIVLCAPLIITEANAQKKTIQAHWAHLVVHGCLHLLGYDHMTKKEQIIMEKLETDVLNKLGFSNPY